jgi:aspartate kinase
MDMLLTSGERISISLLCMALIDRGQRAVSFTGSQAGIVTDSSHGKARIVEVRAERIRETIEAGDVAVVAGFQGVSTARDVTTLGRGGSDTTAVALAAVLGAEACEIYTDVAGVFTADPRVVPEARKLHAVSYEEMLEMAAAGARVLQLRAVEYARGSGVMLHVRSSFTDEAGTWVREADERMEQAIISGVVHDTGEAKITLQGVPDRPGIAATIFRAVADEGINVDTIVQNVSKDGLTDLSFTVPKDDLSHAAAVMEGVVKEVGAERHTTDDRIATVSLIGAGMKTHPGVQADMFSALAEAGINIEMISTSSIRITCVIRADDVEEAVRALHARFALSEQAVVREH